MDSTRPRQVSGFLTYPEARDAGLIEDGVKDLVSALNESGTRTIASCEGHAARGGWLFARRAVLVERPYVLFEAPLPLARSLAQLLGNGRGHNELRFCWLLSAYFRPPTFEMAWTLELDDFRARTLWTRATLDSDLNILARMVRRARDEVSLQAAATIAEKG